MNSRSLTGLPFCKEIAKWGPIQNLNSKLKAFLTSGYKLRLCFLICSFLAFCSSTSLAGVEISSRQLDPTDLLVSHLTLSPQNANASNIPQDSNTPYRTWEPSAQVAKVKYKPNEQSQTSGSATVNFAAYIDKKTQRNDLLISKNPNNPITRQLWQARITAFKGEEDNKSKNELQRLIEQIRSVEFKPPEEPAEPFIIVEPVQEPEPNETLDTHPPEESQKKKIESKPLAPSFGKSQDENQLGYELITNETLQMIDSQLQHPEQLKNPFELAEVFFRCGRLKEAGVCYQRALSRESTDKTDPNQDTAWILLQIGNCFQNDDPNTAMQAYRQLITEYPDSLWTDLAQAQYELVNWFQQYKPRTLINENQW